ncbi:MAG: putative toxin-antitoxin system toxin component, PIN family [Myxococcota bacterium]
MARWVFSWNPLPLTGPASVPERGERYGVCQSEPPLAFSGVVLDTSVVFSALRSRRGASFQLLSRVGTGAFEIAVSVPLVLEYEDVCMRKLDDLALEAEDVQAILDYVCSVARHQHIFFLWRPLLRDPKDDMVAELAFASGCDVIVTHNRRDFEQVESLGVRVVGPAVFLRELES